MLPFFTDFTTPPEALLLHKGVLRHVDGTPVKDYLKSSELGSISEKEPLAVCLVSRKTLEAYQNAAKELEQRKFAELSGDERFALAG